MNVKSIRDDLGQFQALPANASPNGFANGYHSQEPRSIAGQTQQPGPDDDQDDGYLDPDTGTETDPSELPDEAPAVEPEDTPGDKASTDRYRMHPSKMPM